MNNEERLIEVMAELLAEVHEMRVETKRQLGDVHKSIDALSVRVGKLDGQMTKGNLQLGENTRAILKLADRVEVVPTLMERVIRLETEVFRKAS